jgi:hypothetical protein
MAKTILIHNLSVPLNGATAIRFDIHAGDGNLSIDGTPGNEKMLASGTLEYLETQKVPAQSLEKNRGLATFTLQGGQSKQPRFRMPWSACNGATNWLIHLNPQVSSDITARSDGGNIKLDMSGTTPTSLSAETGGGNITLVLPDGSPHLTVNARTGAGNVEVTIPCGLAARLSATSGLGKLIIDPRLNAIDKTTFQSPGYENSSRKIEITASSGAGNVIVSIR